MQGITVAMSVADRADDYMRYAEHCLKLVRAIPEQESRMLCREMAGEWLRLTATTVDDAARSAQPSGQRRKTGRARS
jgi:hypothetical protein